VKREAREYTRGMGYALPRPVRRWLDGKVLGLREPLKLAIIRLSNLVGRFHPHPRRRTPVPIEDEIGAIRAMKVVGRHHSLRLIIDATRVRHECLPRLWSSLDVPQSRRADPFSPSSTEFTGVAKGTGRPLRAAFAWRLTQGGTKRRAAGLGQRSHQPAQAADTAPKAAGLPHSARLP
jgi:hypothetical protein